MLMLGVVDEGRHSSSRVELKKEKKWVMQTQTLRGRAEREQRTQATKDEREGRRGGQVEEGK